MAKYYFEKDLEVNYFYRDGAVPSSDSPTVFLFRGIPSRADAKTGLGAIKAVTSWANSINGDAKVITIPEVDDPNPDSSFSTEAYYLAINYSLEIGGDKVTDLQEIFIERAGGNLSDISFYVEDLKKVYPQINNYSDDIELGEYIETAERVIRLDFERKGYDFDRIKNKDQLYLLAAYKTISLITGSKYKSAGDGLYDKHLQFESNYKDTLSGLKLIYDKDGDGVKDSEAGTSVGYSYSIK